MTKTKNKCLVCGKNIPMFYNKTQKRMYCSKKCGQKQWGIRLHHKPTNRKCITCGNILYGYAKKYCSPKCYPKLPTKKDRCIVCGKLKPAYAKGVTAAILKKIYCSEKCRKNARERRSHNKPIENSYYKYKTCIECGKKEIRKNPLSKRKFFCKVCRTRKCGVCGKIKILQKNEIGKRKRNKYFYCSRKCYYLGQTIEHNSVWNTPEGLKRRKTRKARQRESNKLYYYFGSMNNTKTPVKKMLATTQLSKRILEGKIPKEQLDEKLEAIKVGNTHEVYA